MPSLYVSERDNGGSETTAFEVFGNGDVLRLAGH